MTYLIKEQRTRFIYPFSFQQPLQATQLIAALETLHYREKPVWQRVEPHHFYTRETLEMVNSFLFKGGQGGGTYFKVTAEVAATWFQNAVTVATQREKLTAKLETLAGIELFIAPQSVGILSITLNVAVVTNVQRKVEWLEVFFVSFYATELVHLITKALSFASHYARWSIIIWPIFAGGMTFWGLKPHSHHDQKSSYLPAFILLISAILWFVGGWWFFGGRGPE
jgi:hypothetical protein